MMVAREKNAVLEAPVQVFDLLARLPGGLGRIFRWSVNTFIDQRSDTSQKQFLLLNVDNSTSSVVSCC